MALQRHPLTYSTNEYLVSPLEFQRAAGRHVTVPMPALRGDMLPPTYPLLSGSHTAEPSYAGKQSVLPAITHMQALPPQATNSAASPSVPASPQELVPRARLVATNARQSHQVNNRRKRGQYDPQVWEDHKDKIKHLYLTQGKPLREVVEAMAKSYNFHATEKMFKIRIKQWGFSKNNTRKDVAQMLKTRFVREAMGKRSEFVRNGRTVDIDNYLRRKGLTEYDVVDLESTVEDALRIVRCRTPPEPEHLAMPERLKHQEGYMLALRKALMFWAADPREKDRNYYLKKDYTYIKDLRDAQGLAQKGQTGQAIQILQTVLQTKLRDIDQVDAAGGLWLLLVPITWSQAPIVSTILFKYLAASGAIKNQKGHPVYSALKFAYDTLRESGLAELKFIVDNSLTTVYGEVERAMGSDYGIITRMWPWYAAQRGPTTTWMMRGEILRQQKQSEKQLGVCSRQSLWQRLCYAVSFAPGSEKHLAELQSLYEAARLSSDFECLSIARGAAYFTYGYHWSICKKEPAEYNMRLSLAKYWFAKANEVEGRLNALKRLGNSLQPASHPAGLYRFRLSGRSEEGDTP